MRWMEIAWADLGVKEIAGPDANPRILSYFKSVGRADIISDEISWCAACTGAWLSEGGIKVDIPPEKRLLARSYLNFGTPINEPRVGAVAIFSRDEAGPDAGHVGLITGWTDTHIKLLSGNTSNAVTEQLFPRTKLLGIRWPLALTADELAAQGSRTVQKTSEQQKDAVKGTAAAISIPALPEGFTALAKQANELQGSLKSLAGFLEFAAQKWIWIGASIAAWYGLKLLYSSGLIKAWRVEDANTGTNVARQTKEAPA